MIGLPGVIAGRYLRSRRSARFVSLITLIATGGITIGVMALIVVLGVMNGLQHELREKILVGSPHLRLLTFGEGLRMDAWAVVLPEVRRDPDVVAAEPFVLTQGLFSAGHDYHEGAYLLGIEPDTGAAAVTRLPQTFVRGDLSFTTTRDDVDGGIVLGRRLAERFSAFPGATVTAISPGGSRFSPSVGGRFMADLPALARGRLNARGVAEVHGGGQCTYSDARRFYSYRRDGRTGRMAALAWLA